MSDALPINNFNGGDKNAFTKVYKHYYPPVFGFIKKILINDLVAEEITNDCFLELNKGAKTFAAEPQLKAYLYVTAKNKSLNYLKNADRTKYRADEYTRLQPADAYTEDVIQYEIKQADFRAAVDKELKKLSMIEREVFEMAFFKKMKAKEIATVKDIKERQVYQYKDKVLKALKRIFGRDFHKYVSILFIGGAVLDFLTKI